jgi:hypothetical protein
MARVDKGVVNLAWHHLGSPTAFVDSYRIDSFRRHKAADRDDDTSKQYVWKLVHPVGMKRKTLTELLVKSCFQQRKSVDAPTIYFFRTTLKAQAAAPNPLSMFNTDTPGAQLLSIVSIAETPPKETP